MDEPALQKTMDTLDFLSQNEEARRLYEQRQRALHDEASLIDGAKEEGRREGQQEGRKVEKHEIAKNLLALGLDLAQIVRATGLTDNEVLQLKKELH